LQKFTFASDGDTIAGQANVGDVDGAIVGELVGELEGAKVVGEEVGPLVTVQGSGTLHS
jgi:hypothetical protein